jgi:hypothetical protein
MKIILSRKGFDSTNGGIASPIFAHRDGSFSLYSLPISLQRATCGYEDILWNGSNLQQLISSLRGKTRSSLPNTPHLDPDLVGEALADRVPGWRPIFGQSGATEIQLQNMDVHQPDDPQNRPLFLFFGWYREVQETPTGHSYAPSAADIHTFFGWLQVESKLVLRGLADRQRTIRELPWTARHPHVACEYYDNQSNAIYIAPKPGSETDRLILNGHDTGLPASGMFRRFDRDIHMLTVPGKSRRNWRLPLWFFRAGEPTLGMHQKPKQKWRWQLIPNDPEHVELQSVDRGQEFVLDSKDHDEEQVRNWIERIVKSGQPKAMGAAGGVFGSSDIS